MADQYTEVRHTSFLGNVFNSIFGAILGVLLFFGSFFVLWMNEGRVNLSTIAQKSTPMAATAVDPTMEGKLVAATGKLVTNEKLGDSGYLRPQNYLELQRTVEMYAWVEHTDSDTTKNVGGSSTTKTTYTYKKEWTSSPSRSSSFKYPGGHENPSMPLESSSWTPSSATVGVYGVHPGELTLPDAIQVRLNEENTEVEGPWQIKSDYIVNSASALTTPNVGDVRISYSAVPNNLDVTLFGKVSAEQILPYEAEGTSLYRAFTENREQAIATLDTEHRIWTWVLRLIGFLMMWIGLSMCFEPLNTMLDVLPFLGSAGRFVTGSIMFGVSLLLSIITIIASIIAHNIFLLIGLLLLVMGAVVLWSRVRRPKAAAMPA